MSGNHDSIAECKAKDSALTRSQRAIWLRRATYAGKASCPDESATTACSSFDELLKANDVDILDDFAQRDHLYVCFRPNQDVFMEVYYSDADSGFWQRDDRTYQAQHFGSAGIIYYKAGIGSDDMSFHDMGRWTFSIDRNVNVMAIRKAPSDAVFRGSKILIQGSHLEATESYKNDAGTNTDHNLTLQLSTGRFVEGYSSLSGSTQTYAGRCLVLPPTVN